MRAGNEAAPVAAVVVVDQAVNQINDDVLEAEDLSRCNVVEVG